MCKAGDTPNPGGGEAPCTPEDGSRAKLVLVCVPSQEASVPDYLAPDYRQYRPDVFEH
jgi:hypothetical protein